jgi:hypothetical protein
VLLFGRHRHRKSTCRPAASIASGFVARAILWKLGIELILRHVGLAQKRTSPELPYNGSERARLGTTLLQSSLS